jgi:DNA-binding GntR family transcriptional regulator
MIRHVKGASPRSKPALKPPPGAKSPGRKGRNLRSGTTLADALYQSLKRAIIENRLEPGTILSEQTIAARHSVSRAPAREALKRLTVNGFVTTRHRVGYLVTNVSVADMDEIFAMRLRLEPMATELAVPRLTSADLEILEELASQVPHVAEAPIKDHGNLYTTLNANFHREIARIAGNRRLERTIHTLIDELERVMLLLAYSSTIDQLLDQHSELLRVMRSGDAGAAAGVMHEQLYQDFELMRPLLLGTAGPLSLP